MKQGTKIDIHVVVSSQKIVGRSDREFDPAHNRLHTSIMTRPFSTTTG